MALVRCSECGKEISDTAKKCEYCGVVFDEDDYEDENEKEVSVKKTSTTNEEIPNTYQYFLRYAKSVKMLYCILAVIIILLGLLEAEDTSGASILMAIVVAISFLSIGIFTEKNFQWKAYMLQLVHEINMKKNK